ncbi:transposase [Halobacteriaceae archaeon GCM10025711]
MDKLDGVPGDELRAHLAETDDPKAVKRLMVALAYKDGVSVSRLSARYGIPRSTVYYWLDRFADEPVADAVVDDPRPGRPSELDTDERDRLAAALADSPAEHGFDGGEWTPDRVQEFLEQTFEVSYSTGHVRRLLRELG